MFRSILGRVVAMAGTCLLVVAVTLATQKTLFAGCGSWCNGTGSCHNSNAIQVNVRPPIYACNTVCVGSLCGTCLCAPLNGPGLCKCR